MAKDSWRASLKVSWFSADKGKESMAVNVEVKIRKLSTSQHTKVDVRAAELIVEEMTRREHRKARRRTELRLAKRLEISQDSVSRFE
ncbi:MAG: hypothetical protein F4X19_05645 [Acidobacteria bacterium]|nr:hypothetical protein [Acidobacteriota bacterium]